MESSIAVFLMRQLACEQLPTSPSPHSECHCLLAAQPLCGQCVQCWLHKPEVVISRGSHHMVSLTCSHSPPLGILAEGAIALPVTLSGGALFAS
jgi:hypothetical protein